MPDQKKPEQKTARNTTRTSGSTRSQSIGDDVISSDIASDRPAGQTASNQEAAASQGRSLTDVESLQQTAADYFSRISSSAGDLTVQARRVYDSSQSFVRSYPGQTVGGAFLAGLVLGLFMRRD